MIKIIACAAIVLLAAGGWFLYRNGKQLHESRSCDNRARGAASGGMIDG